MGSEWESIFVRFVAFVGRPELLLSSLCSSLARRVEEAADGKLTALSLRGPDVRSILDEVKPGWRWEPMLLEVDGDRWRVYAGIGMRARLVRVLGPRRALRLAQIVQNAMVFQPGRRGVLKQMIGVLTGIILVGQAPKSLASDPVPDARPSHVYLPLVSSGGQSGRIHAKMLSGIDLKEAVAAARSYPQTDKLRRFLLDQGYNDDPNLSTAVRVDLDEKNHVLLVTLPFHSSKDGDAQIKFIRHGSHIDTGIGILHERDGVVSEIEVCELVKGNVERTKRLSRKRDRIVVAQSTGQISELDLTKDITSPQSDSCSACLDICSLVYSIGCGVSGYLACNLICLSVAYVLCPLICAAVYAAVCWWAVGWGCDTICGSPEGLGYC
ncbi:MAG: hypothetical protein D6694_11240 [Gammaproteobacteria bacterium]|nr:MAG: hypothetical protein D6694_11240 [Gammaproteobacteria bacterium]